MPEPNCYSSNNNISMNKSNPTTPIVFEQLVLNSSLFLPYANSYCCEVGGMTMEEQQYTRGESSDLWSRNDEVAQKVKDEKRDREKQVLQNPLAMKRMRASIREELTSFEQQRLVKKAAKRAARCRLQCPRAPRRWRRPALPAVCPQQLPRWRPAVCPQHLPRRCPRCPRP